MPKYNVHLSIPGQKGSDMVMIFLRAPSEEAALRDATLGAPEYRAACIDDEQVDLLEELGVSIGFADAVPPGRTGEERLLKSIMSYHLPWRERMRVYTG